VRGQARRDRHVQISQAGLTARRRDERRDKPGLPRHHLEDHLREIDPRQQRVHVAAQLGQARGVVDRFEALDVQLPVTIEADGRVRLQAPADGAVRRVEGPGVLGQQIIRGRRQRQGLQHRVFRVRPRLASE